MLSSASMKLALLALTGLRPLLSAPASNSRVDMGSKVGQFFMVLRVVRILIIFKVTVIKVFIEQLWSN